MLKMVYKDMERMLTNFILIVKFDSTLWNMRKVFINQMNL